MSRGRIHLYWLLIAIPTLLLGMASVRLLLGEEARLRALARRADIERAERLAETVRGMVASVRQNVMEQLAALPAVGYQETLGDWMSRDPRIRNVFVWLPGKGVVLPPARGGNAEERRFLQRYAPLFEGEVPWAQRPVADDGGLTPHESRLAGAPGARGTRPNARQGTAGCGDRCAPLPHGNRV